MKKVLLMVCNLEEEVILKKIFALIMVAALFTGCASNTTTINSTNENNYSILDSKQIEYLTETALITKERLEKMSYESINWELLGTGLELYNKTSGVEINGITYASDKTYVGTEKNNAKDITYEEVYKLREKDEKITLDDFAGYNYTVKDIKSGYVMDIPIEGYEDSYVRVIYKVLEDGKISMKCPIWFYDGEGEDDYTFSILYDQALIEAFYDNNDFSYEDKLIFWVQYTSVTDNTLVLAYWNYTDEDVEFTGNLNIKSDEEIVCNASAKAFIIEKMSGGIIPVQFDKNLVEGKYTIGFNEEIIEFER